MLLPRLGFVPNTLMTPAKFSSKVYVKYNRTVVVLTPCPILAPAQIGAHTFFSTANTFLSFLLSSWLIDFSLPHMGNLAFSNLS